MSDESALPAIDPDSPTNDAVAVERGRLMFAGPCDFIHGTNDLGALPDMALPEIAFAGRSNVGKSSLVNALTGRKTLARTSQTPGRTQQINFFNLSKALYLVDLPGYGYAKASKSSIKSWTHLVDSYLKGRASLARVIVLIDSRHGLKDKDRDVMTMLDVNAVPYQLVLTKIDKTTGADLTKCMADTHEELRKHVAAHPEIIATSSDKAIGIEALRAHISTLADSTHF
jgi:GTP-binding protein